MCKCKSKKQILAEYLECIKSDIIKEEYDENLYSYGNQSYLILSEKQALRRCKEYILDSLWAFNSDFIVSQLNIYNEINTLTIEDVDNLKELCENANPIIRNLIGENINNFINEAIATDGMGHFLASYDGVETIIDNKYIYRIN